MTRRPRSWRISLTTVAALWCAGATAILAPATALAAGEAGATASPGVAAPEDPCALLTVDEAAGALHTRDPLTTQADMALYPACYYLLPDGSSVLDVDFLPDGKGNYEFVTANAQPVSEVGDQAAYLSDERLVFLVGDLKVTAYQRWLVNEAVLPALTAIAKIIAARLQTGAVPPEVEITAPPFTAAKTACDLLPAEEAASFLDRDAVSPDDYDLPQFCYYSATSGEVLIVTYFQRSGGVSAWPEMKASMGADPVSGLGDEAMFDSFRSTLYVLKDDAIFNVSLLGLGLDPDASLALGRGIAETMLGHL